MMFSDMILCGFKAKTVLFAANIVDSSFFKR